MKRIELLHMKDPNKPIQAIKALRSTTNMGLKESKVIVDTLRGVGMDAKRPGVCMAQTIEVRDHVDLWELREHFDLAEGVDFQAVTDALYGVMAANGRNITVTLRAEVPVLTTEIKTFKKASQR